MKPEPVDVFVSYSHRDASSLEELRLALRHLEREGRLDIWDDTVLRPGENWARERRERLDSAQVIVTLLSPNLIASSFWTEEEWPAIHSRMRSAESTIIPILLAPVRLPPELSALQVLPKDGRPISSHDDRNRAWISIANEIGRLSDQLRGEAPRSPVRSWPEDGAHNSMHSEPLDTEIVVRALKRAGFEVQQRAGPHYVLRDDSDPSRVVVLPRKAKDIRGGLLRQILKAANISPEEFWSLLEGL
jgi:predicted RNA binding protein YcfA (HicA-like mRNA interferase family)